MRLTTVLVISSCVAFGALSSPAMGDLVPWSQEFAINSTSGSFHVLNVNLGTTGQGLADPYIFDLAPNPTDQGVCVWSDPRTDWVAVSTDDLCDTWGGSSGTGAYLTDLGFKLQFEGNVEDPVSFDAQVSKWNKFAAGRYGWKQIGQCTVSWDGLAWSIADDSSSGWDLAIIETQPVPVPGAALLGILGLGYAGARLRRRG